MQNRGVTPTQCHWVLYCTKSPSLLLFESVQSRFPARKHCCLLLLLLSFHFKFHFVLHSLPDDILGGQMINMSKIVSLCQINLKRVYQEALH